MLAQLYALCSNKAKAGKKEAKINPREKSVELNGRINIRKTSYKTYLEEGGGESRKTVPCFASAHT